MVLLPALSNHIPESTELSRDFHTSAHHTLQTLTTDVTVTKAQVAGQ